jgi:hypothetical protein
MLGLRLQYHQIHYVDDPDADVGDIRAQEGHGSERLKGVRQIAGRSSEPSTFWSRRATSDPRQHGTEAL